MSILASGKPFPASNYIDATGYLKKSEIIGAFLEEEELYDLKLSLLTIIQILGFLKTNRDEFPELFQLISDISVDQTIYDLLESKIDERGKIRDNASRELINIRSRISKSSGRARSAVTRIMKEASSSGFCPEGASITVRDGRIVIPVLAEYKRRVKGFVHDESATGQTVYLEPAEALEINNELRELEYAERREVIRILTHLTGEVRVHAEELKEAWKFLGIIDFIRAKSRFAQQLSAICPKINANPLFKWKDARHPLLELALKEQSKKVTPQGIELSKDDRILLISGPNAGGKSVCLKTIGLLQYMVQCGLPVPCNERSEFGIFQNIFLDIGDEQSIENDLSTYSSHLKNMKFFVENANQKTLFLIDEFGTGTEPQFGGAIAEVILGRLNEKKSFGAATTHYANLKKMADNTDGIVNGSMKYDVRQLLPLYELEIGKPGSSFALEIAGKIGLEPELLNRAKKLAGHSHVKFDRLINELEADKNILEKKLKEVTQKEGRLNDAIKDYDELKIYLEKQKSSVIKEAKHEAGRILKESNKRIEETIRTIQEGKAEKKKTLDARQKLGEYQEKIKVPKETKPADSSMPDTLQVGDKVRLKGRDTVGEILTLKGKKIEVGIGSIKSLIKSVDLEKISNKAYKDMSNEKVRRISGIDINAKMSSFRSNLDIRGVRADEAIGKVESFVDEAILLGQEQLRVIHGKGHGILRETIRNVLRGNPRIEKMADEHIEHGGSGVTVIDLK